MEPQPNEPMFDAGTSGVRLAFYGMTKTGRAPEDSAVVVVVTTPNDPNPHEGEVTEGSKLYLGEIYPNLPAISTTLSEVFSSYVPGVGNTEDEDPYISHRLIPFGPSELWLPDHLANQRDVLTSDPITPKSAPCFEERCYRDGHCEYSWRIGDWKAPLDTHEPMRKISIRFSPSGSIEITSIQLH